MMQQMGFDISTGLSLCDGRGQLAPFKKSLSQAQLDALHEDKILKEEKYGLGYEVHMTSVEPIDVTPASLQMEDGYQPTIDELEEIKLNDNKLIKLDKEFYLNFYNLNVFDISNNNIENLNELIKDVDENNNDNIDENDNSDDSDNDEENNDDFKIIKSYSSR